MTYTCTVQENSLYSCSIIIIINVIHGDNHQFMIIALSQNQILYILWVMAYLVENEGRQLQYVTDSGQLRDVWLCLVTVRFFYTLTLTDPSPQDPTPYPYGWS